MFSFLSAGPFVYIEINHVAPENFGYYFALNIVFLFVMTIFNSRFVRRIGALNMFRSGLWIQFIMAAWMVISALLGLGFWSLWWLALRRLWAACRWCHPMRWRSFLMSFPSTWVDAISLAGTFRFGIGAIVGALLSLATFNSAWPMIWSIAFCANQLHSLLVCTPVGRKNGDLLHNEEAKELPLLMHVNHKSIIPPYMFILCKINLYEKLHHCS